MDRPFSDCQEGPPLYGPGMFIGHLPAGYVACRLLRQEFREGVSDRAFFGWGMAGALAPDLDMFYFYLTDQRQHHHHSYVTHWPVLWLCALVLATVWLRRDRVKPGPVLGFIFCLNGFIHMFLDSIVGDIWWLMPLVDRPFALATVHRVMEPWWLNFMLHWSFGLELLVIAWAAWLWRKSSVKV